MTSYHVLFSPISVSDLIQRYKITLSLHLQPRLILTTKKPSLPAEAKDKKEKR
jgi:hypothetical protein